MPKHILEDTNPEHYFYLKEGKIVKNLRQLKNVLRTMSDEEFYHHVTEHRNDFYTWVNDVYGDKKLSDLLSKCRTKREMGAAIEKRFKEENMAKKKKMIVGKIRKTAKKPKKKVKIKPKTAVRKVVRKMSLQRYPVAREYPLRRETTVAEVIMDSLDHYLSPSRLFREFKEALRIGFKLHKR